METSLHRKEIKHRVGKLEKIRYFYTHTEDNETPQAVVFCFSDQILQTLAVNSGSCDCTVSTVATQAFPPHVKSSHT